MMGKFDPNGMKRIVVIVIIEENLNLFFLQELLVTNSTKKTLGDEAIFWNENFISAWDQIKSDSCDKLALKRSFINRPKLMNQIWTFCEKHAICWELISQNEIVYEMRTMHGDVYIFGLFPSCYRVVCHRFRLTK